MVDYDAAAVRVQVVILNYRTPDLVIDCLRFVERDAVFLPSQYAIVADNDPRDDSARCHSRTRAALVELASVPAMDRHDGFVR